MTLDDIIAGQKISDADLLELIVTNVDPRVTVCRLQYGSVIYLCFGDKVPHHVGNSIVHYGEADIYFEADDWSISVDGNEVFDSETITRVSAETILNDLISGRKIENISSKDGYRVLEFSSDLVVRARNLPEFSEPQDELFSVELPNGHIVSLYADSVNVATGSFTDAKSRHWRSQQG